MLIMQSVRHAHTSELDLECRSGMRGHTDLIAAAQATIAPMPMPTFTSVAVVAETLEGCMRLRTCCECNLAARAAVIAARAAVAVMAVQIGQDHPEWSLLLDESS